jgi:hypothetical protein
MCPVFARYTLAFALQLRKERKNLSQGSWMETEYTEQSLHNNKHKNKNTKRTELNKIVQNIQPYTQTEKPKEHHYTTTLS